MTEIVILMELYVGRPVLQYFQTMMYSMSRACQQWTGACQDAPEGDAGRSPRQRHLGFSAWPTDVAICSGSPLSGRRTSSPVWNLKDVYRSLWVGFYVALHCKHTVSFNDSSLKQPRTKTPGPEEKHHGRLQCSGNNDALLDLPLIWKGLKIKPHDLTWQIT